MPADGATHEISKLLGELLAGQRALDAKIDANHTDAEKHWTGFYDKLREVNHATANLAQADIGHVHALRNMGQKMKPLEKLPEAVAAVDRRIAAVEVASMQVESLTIRLGSIEKMAYRMAGIATAVSVGCSIIGAIILRYGVHLFHWLTGKP